MFLIHFVKKMQFISNEESEKYMQKRVHWNKRSELRWSIRFTSQKQMNLKHLHISANVFITSALFNNILDIWLQLEPTRNNGTAEVFKEGRVSWGQRSFSYDNLGMIETYIAIQAKHLMTTPFASNNDDSVRREFSD